MDINQAFALKGMRDNPHSDKILEELLNALGPITTAARSWHDFHCGSQVITCDEICAALPAAEAAIAKFARRP